MVAISNLGGVEDGADATPGATATINRALAGSGARVQAVKQDLLDRADKTGSSLSQLYFTIGMFAVAAGILLLVNVFVMLADERRSELGMLRAVGMRRRTLVAALATEGWIYAVVASALGALLGIGFGRLIAWRADEILSVGSRDQLAAPHVHVRLVDGAHRLRGRSRGRDRHHPPREHPHLTRQHHPGRPRHHRARRAPARGGAWCGSAQSRSSSASP